MKSVGMLLILVAAFLTGCNAVKGAARDVSNVAQHTEDWVQGNGKDE